MIKTLSTIATLMALVIAEPIPLVIFGGVGADTSAPEIA